MIYKTIQEPRPFNLKNVVLRFYEIKESIRTDPAFTRGHALRESYTSDGESSCSTFMDFTFAAGHASSSLSVSSATSACRSWDEDNLHTD